MSRLLDAYAYYASEYPWRVLGLIFLSLPVWEWIAGMFLYWIGG